MDLCNAASATTVAVAIAAWRAVRQYSQSSSAPRDVEQHDTLDMSEHVKLVSESLEPSPEVAIASSSLCSTSLRGA